MTIDIVTLQQEHNQLLDDKVRLKREIALLQAELARINDRWQAAVGCDIEQAEANAAAEQKIWKEAYKNP